MFGEKITPISLPPPLPPHYAQDQLRVEPRRKKLYIQISPHLLPFNFTFLLAKSKEGQKKKKKKTERK